MDICKATFTALTEDILRAIGTPGSSASAVTKSLVQADERGFPGHGLSLLPLYRNMVDAGVIKVNAEPTGEALSECIAKVDGKGSFGQLTGRFAVDYGLSMVDAHGLAAVGVVEGSHLGRLGEWAERACNAGIAFLAFSNTGGGAITVAGAGGARRVLAPNPIAFGIPTFSKLASHVIVDFSTAQASGSRIREIANAGERLNPDWVISESGRSTDDPQAFLDGLAALRPLGGASAGHKGFGLMIVAEMLSALAGGLMAGEDEVPWFSNGSLFIFLDVRRFVSPEEWGQRAEAFAKYVNDRGYRLPGSGRSTAQAGRLQLAEHTVSAMLALAEELSVDRRGLSMPGPPPDVIKTW